MVIKYHDSHRWSHALSLRGYRDGHRWSHANQKLKVPHTSRYNTNALPATVCREGKLTSDVVRPPVALKSEENHSKYKRYVGHLESKERLRIQPAQLFNFS